MAILITKNMAILINKQRISNYEAVRLIKENNYCESIGWRMKMESELLADKLQREGAR